MPNHQKSGSVDEWKRYAELLDQIEELHFELMNEMSGNVPETVSEQGWEKMHEGQTKLKSDLEDRFAEEHPDEFDTHVFYGNS